MSPLSCVCVGGGGEGSIFAKSSPTLYPASWTFPKFVLMKS
jgi:hypothetical protein